MWKDPIVEEVRKAGRKIERQAGGNLREFFQLLRKSETGEYPTRGSKTKAEAASKAWAVAEGRSYGKR